jgi:hypothetical protein
MDVSLGGDGMSVIVKDIFGKEMPMPQEGYVDIRLHFKGGRVECATMPIGNPPYYATFKVVKLPPHGRLVDLDKMVDEYWDGSSMRIGKTDIKDIEEYDTVIEAEGSEE